MKIEDKTSEIIFEMICLSNEIRYYVRRLAKKLGITVNEFLVLNVIGLSECYREEEIRNKLYINQSTFIKVMDKLYGKGYIEVLEGSFFKLTPKGEKSLKKVSKESSEFFDYLLKEEERQTEGLIGDLNRKISEINIMGKKEHLIN